MRFALHGRQFQRRVDIARLPNRFRKNEDGSNAIEFAAVATPFFMFIFGIIGVAFNFFVDNSIENGMARQSRLIRTGEAQEKGTKVDEFKQELCTKAGSWIDCTKLQVFIQTASAWDQVNPTTCVDASGNATVNATPGGAKIADYTGAANAIVVVTACYKWDFTQKLPSWIKLGNMNDKSRMMQSMTAFRTEPYTPSQ